MADEELVAKVIVEGTDESAAELAAYAAAGKASFDKLNAAAAKAAAGVKASTASVEGSTKDAGAALKGMGDTKISPAMARDIKSLQTATSDFTNSLRRGVKDVSAFAFSIAKMGTAAAAAVGGVLALASSVAKQVAGTSDALDKQTKSQIDANNAQLSGEQAIIGYQSSQRQLMAQFKAGAISYSDYSDGIKKLNADYKEQQFVAAQTAAATDRVRDANDKLQKKLADQKAYDALIAKFGGPLLTSLTSLGREVNSLFDQFKQAFGPPVAALLDVLDASLTKNHSAIVAWFDDVSAMFGRLVKENGPAIATAFENIGRISGSIFKGLIQAMPMLLDLFNNKLVPAIDMIGARLTSLTETINSTFGTNFTAGGVAVVIALTYMTGGFKLLFSVLRIVISGVRLVVDNWKLLTIAFRALQAIPMVRFITLIGLALVLLYYYLKSVNWKEFGEQAIKVVGAIVTKWTEFVMFIGSLPARIGAIFVALWLLVTTGVGVAVAYIIGKWNEFVTFITGLPATVGAIFVALWALVTEGVNAAVQWVINKWNEAVAFFQGLPARIGQVFVDAGTAIKAAFNEALTKVGEAIKKFLDDYTPGVVKLIARLWEAAKAANTAPSGGDGGGNGGDLPRVQANARGGMIHGPGTGTSDSILSWLSNNEYVVRARAVAKYGKGFMDAVNSGRLSLDGLQHFAAGGLVSPFQQPRLALASSSNGPKTASRIVNLTIGDQRFENMLAPEDVADRMERYAVARNSSSAGRKPSWVGGSR